eukprot:Ihof_evm4s3 gene=Ihof_evmTU4s3
MIPLPTSPSPLQTDVAEPCLFRQLNKEKNDPLLTEDSSSSSVCPPTDPNIIRFGAFTWEEACWLQRNECSGLELPVIEHVPAYTCIPDTKETIVNPVAVVEPIAPTSVCSVDLPPLPATPSGPTPTPSGPTPTPKPNVPTSSSLSPPSSYPPTPTPSLASPVVTSHTTAKSLPTVPVHPSLAPSLSTQHKPDLVQSVQEGNDTIIDIPAMADYPYSPQSHTVNPKPIIDQHVKATNENKAINVTAGPPTTPLHHENGRTHTSHTQTQSGPMESQIKDRKITKNDRNEGVRGEGREGALQGKASKGRKTGKVDKIAPISAGPGQDHQPKLSDGLPTNHIASTGQSLKAVSSEMKTAIEPEGANKRMTSDMKPNMIGRGGVQTKSGQHEGPINEHREDHVTSQAIPLGKPTPITTVAGKPTLIKDKRGPTAPLTPTTSPKTSPVTMTTESQSAWNKPNGLTNQQRQIKASGHSIGPQTTESSMTRAPVSGSEPSTPMKTPLMSPVTMTASPSRTSGSTPPTHRSVSRSPSTPTMSSSLRTKPQSPSPTLSPPSPALSSPAVPLHSKAGGPGSGWGGRSPLSLMHPKGPSAPNNVVPMALGSQQRPLAPNTVGSTVGHTPAGPGPQTSWSRLFPKEQVEPPGASRQDAGERKTTGQTIKRSNPASDIMKNFKVEKYFTALPYEPRGLVNTGYMCYIHSILQTMIGCRPLTSFLRELRALKTTGKVDADIVNVKNTPVLDCLIQFEAEMKLADTTETEVTIGAAFVPDMVYNVVQELWQGTGVLGCQEDAQEFLTFLLDHLHEDCLRLLSNVPQAAPSSHNGDTVDDWEEVGPKNRTTVTRHNHIDASPISAIFSARMRSMLKINNKKPSVTYQPYNCLPLDIQSPDVNTVYEALTHLFVKESVDGVKCPNTKQELPASKQSALEELPPVLVLHLKRFVYDTTLGATLKVHKTVDYSLRMEIGKDLLSSTAQGKVSLEGRTYKLYAVVYHHGN